MTPKEQVTKAEIDKWDYIKLKVAWASKNTISRIFANKGRECLQIIWMIKDLYPEYYEELPQFNVKKKKKT